MREVREEMCDGERCKEMKSVSAVMYLGTKGPKNDEQKRREENHKDTQDAVPTVK